MKSFLQNREHALQELYEKIFNEYPLEKMEDAVIQLIQNVKRDEVNRVDVQAALQRVLGKTETFNVLLTLWELEKRCEWDEELLQSMKDPSYNQHRTIAINICDMYSSGATSFFGYMDCMFRSFFPQKHPKSFLAKGICALVASSAEIVVTGTVAEDYAEENINILKSRGIDVQEMIEMVHMLQYPYNPTITMETCKEHVLGVLRKQQTYHTIQLCVKIDRGVENREFGDQFQAIVGNDEGLYGVDETVNTSISKMYGMIAITNFGYLDKEKPGIIGRLDNDHEDYHCNTYLDDTVCAIVSAACARLAHNNVNTTSKPQNH